MPTDTFWSNPGKTTPAVSMFDPPTTGDQQENPLLHMPGTLAGAIPTAYTTAAQAVYPWAYNPADPVRAFNPATFPSWHSREQIRYLVANGNVVSIPTLIQPLTSTSPRPQAYYMVSADKTAVINLMTLTVSDYQRLSSADRQALEDMVPPVFDVLVAPTLGLTKDRTVVNKSISDIRNGAALGSLPTGDQDVFKSQLRLIETRMALSPRIAEGNIQKQIAEIGERVRRAAAFATVLPQTNLTVVYEGVDGVETVNGNLTKFGQEFNYYAEFRTEARGRVVSSDDNASITSGYANFMRMERDILTAQLRREALSKDLTFFDPKNDVAQLIYQLQLLYQSETTSVADAGTEEMSQLHKLLADYAIIQRLVNETLKSLNPKDQNEKRRFLNLGGKQDGVDTDQMIRDTDRPGQDTRVTYRWDGGPWLGFGDRSTGGFNGGPRYGWYLLGGTFSNPLISNNQLYRYTKDDSVDPPVTTLQPFGIITGRFAPFAQDDVLVKSGGLSKEEMRVVSMFSKDPWAGGTFAETHPIERLYDVSRATQNLTSESKDDAGSLRLERRDYWDKWSTQLSDNVTLLNQKNQLKQNEIESSTKESNRHFDLGTNALKKMNEMLMAIGRM